MRVWSLGVLVAACGRVGFDGVSSEVPPPVVDGTRLEAWYFTNGSTRLFGGWTDTLLGVDCTFVETTLGELRCLPVGRQNGADFRGQAVYSNPGCSVASLAAYAPARDGSCLPAPTMVTLRDEVYSLGALLGTPPFSLDSGGACSPYSGSPLHYQLGARHDAAEFVLAREEERGTGRIRMRVIVGSDGSRQELAPYDSESALACNVVVGDGQVGCEFFGPDAGRRYGVNGLNTTVFGDATCTIPAALGDGTSPPLSISDRKRSDVCGSPYVDVYETGAQLPGSWYLVDGECRAVLSPNPAYALGPFRQTLTPATGTMSMEGTDRLRPLSVQFDGLAAIVGVWDSATGTTCVPLQDQTSLSWRCMPFDVNDREAVHRAADCSDPYAPAAASCGETRWSLGTLFVSPQPTCGTIGISLRPNTLLSTGLYRAQLGGGCAPVSESLYIDEGVAADDEAFARLDLQFPDDR